MEINQGTPHRKKCLPTSNSQRNDSKTGEGMEGKIQFTRVLLQRIQKEYPRKQKQHKNKLNSISKSEGKER